MNPYDRTKKIDDYLENNMSEEEKKEFEGLLSDPTASLGGRMKLKDEVEMQRTIVKGIQHMALRDMLEEENKSYRLKRKIGISSLISSPIATAVAAVILVMFVLSPAKEFVKTASDEYAKSYNHVEIRGDKALNAAISAVAINQWDSANIFLKEVRKDLPCNPDRLTGNQYDDWFEYHWLKALCEMHRGHVIKTKYHLRKIEKEMINNEDPRLVKAKELKEMIESKQRKLFK